MAEDQILISYYRCGRYGGGPDSGLVSEEGLKEWINLNEDKPYRIITEAHFFDEKDNSTYILRAYGHRIARGSLGTIDRDTWKNIRNSYHRSGGFITVAKYLDGELVLIDDNDMLA